MLNFLIRIITICIGFCISKVMKAGLKALCDISGKCSDAATAKLQNERNPSVAYTIGVMAGGVFLSVAKIILIIAVFSAALVLFDRFLPHLCSFANIPLELVGLLIKITLSKAGSMPISIMIGMGIELVTSCLISKEEKADLMRVTFDIVVSYVLGYIGDDELKALIPIYKSAMEHVFLKAKETINQLHDLAMKYPQDVILVVTIIICMLGAMVFFTKVTSCMANQVPCNLEDIAAGITLMAFVLALLMNRERLNKL